MSITRVLAFLVTLFCLSTNAYALRNDVLIIVNDNSIDSPQVGQYYAQQRGIDLARIVHVKVPNQYFIPWSQFLSLRDQILRFGICPTVPANLQPAACIDSTQAIYTASNVSALTANTPIRYLVTTRGVPTRMTVDNSPYDASSTSVDNYLKYWLARFRSSELSDNGLAPFAADSQARAVAFGDGRGMRLVNPVTDGEYIIGRLDGVNLASANALVDRVIAVEANGWYGKYYGSTFGNRTYGGESRWANYATGASNYPSGDGWRYAFGLFSENRAECNSYQTFFNYWSGSSAGRVPTYCWAQFNKGEPDEAMPGVTNARQPIATDATVYFGSLDGQTVAGGFNTLQNWRKNDSCQVKVCTDAADPAACRATSTDPYRELNTDCVGVAGGFIGYNFQSFPVSLLGVWPTGWITYSMDQNDVPVVDSSQGYDDSYSLWFKQSDEVASTGCYSYAVTGAGSQTPVAGILGNDVHPCPSERKIGMKQAITIQPEDTNNPPTYRLAFYLKGENLPTTSSTIIDRVQFLYPKAAGTPCPSGLIGLASDSQCTYTTSLSHPLPQGNSAWSYASQDLTPPLNTGLAYQSAVISFSGATDVRTGNFGFDAISFKQINTSTELLANGSFTDGHRQTSAGDFAANFLSRLGGTAFWGSLSHHESSGHSFDETSLGTLVYFMRGLPLGDAVWLGEKHVSGMLYGDPTYSPVAVKFNYLLYANDRVVDNVTLDGSTINGRDFTKVSTAYRVDYCAGRDFYVCDLQQSWQSTGLSGAGGQAQQTFGAWDLSTLPYGDYLLRLAVTSTNLASGKSQTFNDYYPVKNRYATAEVPLYSISGTVSDGGGQPVRDVQIQINDNYGFSSTVTTDDVGHYSKTGLKSGTYTVSPTKSGYSITASSGNIFQSVNGANVVKDFTALGQNYSISGLIIDAQGQPVPDAQVVINDNYGFSATTYANVNGFYRRPGVTNGIYTVIATRSGYTIVPSSGNVFQTVNNADVVKDFTATSSDYSIAGTILNTVGQPVSGVIVQINDNYGYSSTVTTNANGYYMNSGMKNGLYIVSPAKAGYGFSANSNNNVVSVSGSNISAKDFTGTKVVDTYSISGFVLENGRPLSGVQMQINDNYGFAATVTTDTAGYFTQGGLKNGMYIVAPSKTAYQFQAVSGNVFQQVQGSNIIDKNYNATRVQ